MRPAAVLLWGLLVHKAFALAAVFAAGLYDPRLPEGRAAIGALVHALSFACGWDAALVLSLAIGGLALGRTRLARASERVFTVVAFGLAIFAVLNLVLVTTFGTPLSASMLAYAADTRAAATAWGPFLLTAGALAVFTAGRWLVVPRLARVPVRKALSGLTFVLALAGVGVALDGDGDARALGLWRSPPAFFALSFVPNAGAPTERAPWDAPTGEPRSDGLVARAPTPRHVVVWLAESTGPRHLSLYGAPADRTPTLESMRQHTLVFDEYYAPTPVSAKAIFSVMCGLFPYPDARFESRLFPRIACPSLPEVLGAQGFQSALFHGGYFAFTDKRALLEGRGFSVLLDGENMPNRDRWWTNGWGIDDAALVEEGLRWLDTRLATATDARTLTVFIPLLPHYEYFLPPNAPRPFGDDDLRARHRNGVRYDDALFGKLVEGYRARGLFQDTLFVFLGDHGEAFDEHANNKLHGSFLYDENVRAPLVMIQPHLFDGERRSARQGAHPDLVPTLLDLLDLEIPAGFQGRSLVAGDFTPRPVPLATFYPEPLVGLVDGPFKLIRNQRTGAEQLFDRALDPHERRNLVHLRPDVASRMRARALDYLERQRVHLESVPARGATALERFMQSAKVSVRRGEIEAPCASRMEGGEPRFVCDGGAWVGLAVERSFNMERRCLIAHAVQDAVVIIRGDASPPPRTVGVGLTDRSRQRKGTPLVARFTIGNGAPVAFTVDDAFESTSRMRSLPPHAGDTATVTIEIESARAENRAACLTLGE
jgi:lipoteichoic acid synthase